MNSAILIVMCLFLGIHADASPWSTWWSYKGLAGPSHWGYLNPEWLLCRSGKLQSPIDIRPRSLLFDPNLKLMKIELPPRIRGVIKNTGNDLTFVFDDLQRKVANFSKGPLLYKYRPSELKIHFGKLDKIGSEHKIDGKQFSAEVQILCYNADLFKTFQEAKKHPHGVAIFAIMAELAGHSDVINAPFIHLTAMASKIPHIGQEARIENFDIHSIIPPTKFYITYEGSFTQPGCYETVTWIIFNKPIFIQSEQLDTLRHLQKHQNDTRMTMLEGNVRPEQPRNNRVLRTNINYPNSGGLCSMKRLSYYEVAKTKRPNSDDGAQ